MEGVGDLCMCCCVLVRFGWLAFGFVMKCCWEFDGVYISGINLSIIIAELPFYLQLSIFSFLIVALLFIIIIITKVLFTNKNNFSNKLIGLFFIGVILFIFNLMVLDDTIDKWEESGQIDEWIDEGVIKIDKMKTYRY